MSLQLFWLEMSAPLEVFAWGDERLLCRPCVDCGLRTGRFCDGWPVRDSCKAAVRIPSEEWAEGQLTPYCSICEDRRGYCHFCRGVSWATPPEWRRHAEVLQHGEFVFDDEEDEESEVEDAEDPADENESDDETVEAPR